MGAKGETNILVTQSTAFYNACGGRNAYNVPNDQTYHAHEPDISCGCLLVGVSARTNNSKIGNCKDYNAPGGSQWR